MAVPQVSHVRQNRPSFCNSWCDCDRSKTSRSGVIRLTRYLKLFTISNRSPQTVSASTDLCQSGPIGLHFEGTQQMPNPHTSLAKRSRARRNCLCNVTQHCDIIDITQSSPDLVLHSSMSETFPFVLVSANNRTVKAEDHTPIQCWGWISMDQSKFC